MNILQVESKFIIDLLESKSHSHWFLGFSINLSIQITILSFPIKIIKKIKYNFDDRNFEQISNRNSFPCPNSLEFWGKGLKVDILK